MPTLENTTTTPKEAQRLDVQRDVIRRSLERLAELATA